MCKLCEGEKFTQRVLIQHQWTQEQRCSKVRKIRTINACQGKGCEKTGEGMHFVDKYRTIPFGVYTFRFFIALLRRIFLSSFTSQNLRFLPSTHPSIEYYYSPERGIVVFGHDVLQSEDFHDF